MNLPCPKLFMSDVCHNDGSSVKTYEVIVVNTFLTLLSASYHCLKREIEIPSNGQEDVGFLVEETQAIRLCCV